MSQHYQHDRFSLYCDDIIIWHLWTIMAVCNPITLRWSTASTCILLLIVTLFTFMQRGDRIPREMQQGFISIIFKTGDRKDCFNHRSTCVRNSVRRIRKTRLENSFVGIESNVDFQLEDRVQIIYLQFKQLLEKCRENVKHFGLVFIDLKKHTRVY